MSEHTYTTPPEVSEHILRESDENTLVLFALREDELVEIARYDCPIGGEIFYTLDGQATFNTAAIRREPGNIFAYEATTYRQTGKNVAIDYRTGYLLPHQVAEIDTKLWPVTRSDYQRQLTIFFKRLKSPFLNFFELHKTKF